MVAIQIRGVSQEVRDALVVQAGIRGQSLQAFMLDLLEAQVPRTRNVAVLDSFTGRTDGTGVQPGETAAELQRLREGQEPSGTAK